MKRNSSKTVEWIVLFCAHILLLYWMYYLLTQAGGLETWQVAGHIFGIALYGALLIRLAAWLNMRRFKREMRDKHRR